MTLADSIDPEESHWKLLAVYLRKERHRHKLSQADVAKIIDADKSRVSNYEAGRLKITKLHAEALDRAWDTMFAVLRKYAVKFSEEDDWVKQLWDFESGALIIKAYIAQFIPVPLQTEGYARGVLEKVRIVDDVETALRNRMTRVANLLDQKTSFWTLIDEVALEMDWLPSKEVKVEQLQALLDLSTRISIRVVEHRDRMHAGTDGSFELISTASGREVGYIWAQMAAKLVSDVDRVRELSLRWDRIGANALTEDRSRELIRQKLERLQ